MHSGLLLEDSLQKAALWQLETLHGEMARYTNLPLSHPENRKYGDKKSKISQSKHGVETEEKVKDVFLLLFFFFEREEAEGYSEKVCVLNGNQSCHTVGQYLTVFFFYCQSGCFCSFRMCLGSNSYTDSR